MVGDLGLHPSVFRAVLNIKAMQAAWWSSGAAWRRPSSSASLCTWPYSWMGKYRASSRCSPTPTSLQQCPFIGLQCRGCSTGPRCRGRLWWGSQPATWQQTCRSVSTHTLPAPVHRDDPVSFWRGLMSANLHSSCSLATIHFPPCLLACSLVY